MLHFYYGVMGSSKSAMLLMQHYNHVQLGHFVVLVKPAIDTRIDSKTVYSRVGLRAQADIILYPDQSLHEQLLWVSARNEWNAPPYVFIDEAQFLSEKQVEEIADLALEQEIYCFGLKTDFMGQFFPGSAALMRLAEEITEVPGGLCWCGCKATMNTRVDADGNVIRTGDQILIDNQTEIRYIGLCYRHWRLGQSHA